MQPAFAGQAEEARLGRIAVAQRCGGVHVADRDITLLRQRVFRQFVLQGVGGDIEISPVGDRVQFPAPIAQFDDCLLYTSRCV